ncbi:MAG: hypothetical protein IRZ14_08775 [Chloroflexi bacterium]|nr:hypothetical protein [Chloroflexota bacterium]
MHTLRCRLRTILLVWLLASMPIVGHHETAVAAVTSLASAGTVALVPDQHHPDVLLLSIAERPPSPWPGTIPTPLWCADQPGQGYCTVLTDSSGPALPPLLALALAAPTFTATDEPSRVPLSPSLRPSLPPPRSQ